MPTFALKNFRCFENTGDVPISPLTFLVGENSTGKSSFLAGFRLFKDACFSSSLSLNGEPFRLGSFNDVIYEPRSRTGRSPKSFSLRWAGDVEDKKSTPSIGITFVNRSGSVTLSKAEFGEGKNYFRLIFTSRRQSARFRFQFRGRTHQGSLKSIWMKGADRLMEVPLAPLFSMAFTFMGAHSKYKAAGQYFDNLHSKIFVNEMRPRAIAPVRSAPLRNYDLEESLRATEGRHIPNYLARIEMTDKRKWRSISTALIKFGKSSGLFSDIRIKRYESNHGPFQLQFRIDGLWRSYADVGYGVAQVLPILVEPFSGKQPLTTALLQQPEVHLHPRAQAELANFFWETHKDTGVNYLVETHSDFLINRARDLVQERRFDSQKMKILYFSRDSDQLLVHPISVDQSGNLIQPPVGYRSFFIQERSRFLRLPKQ